MAAEEFEKQSLTTSAGDGGEQLGPRRSGQWIARGTHAE
jgi:hypothetical protein